MAPHAPEPLGFTDSDSGGVIHIANIKGGVGKSTVATNLASALSLRGPTLIIDLDVQGSATHALGKDPGESQSSSWDLFRSRFHAPQTSAPGASEAKAGPLRRILDRMESAIFPIIMGKGEVASLCTPIHPGLDLIPAASALFNHVNPHHLSNLLFNLQLLRSSYAYIVLDTPSVWNRLTRRLYCASDLNLIPVTLNALSTKSLRDYLVRVRRLATAHPGVRVRIVKNEVFGSQDSKLKGKARTMGENRRFLEGLCEQVAIHSRHGVSFLPQTIMFDLEIPESATVRDAQDEGMPVRLVRQYSSATKAFDALAQRVQGVLNSRTRPAPRLASRLAARAWFERVLPLSRLGWAAAAILVLTINPPVRNLTPPRPVAPQQLTQPPQGVITHVVGKGESMHRFAKHAISALRAVVPSQREIKEYVEETVNIYNLTRLRGEKRIANLDELPPGTVLSFYPPSNLVNPQERQLIPVYRFFLGMVADSLAYVTGDWCERGSGGGVPHYGIDVAATLGSRIISPIDGTAYLSESGLAGRTVGVVHDGAVLFFYHLGRRFVKSGDLVRAGEAVGTVGLSGRTSGPHAHIGYGIRSPSRDVRYGKYNYKVTDPKLFFYRHAYERDAAAR